MFPSATESTPAVSQRPLPKSVHVSTPNVVFLSLNNFVLLATGGPKRGPICYPSAKPRDYVYLSTYQVLSSIQVNDLKPKLFNIILSFSIDLLGLRLSFLS